MDNTNTPPNQGSKVPFDPGWNDPPKLTYSSQQITPNRPRNFLNKRVAFPVSNLPNSDVPPGNIPSMPTAVLPPITGQPPPMHYISKTELPSEELTLDTDNTLAEVKQILLNFLEQSTELGPKANDIKKRLEVMEEFWKSGKLIREVQLKMKELACALRDEEPTKADDIHRGLMIDHVNVVGTWMPGVKQLVHHCIARSELMAIEKEL